MKQILSSLNERWERCVACLSAETVSVAALLFLFALAALFSLLLIQGIAVSSIMEARNLRAAEEIIESGNWLLPTLNANPRILKPPLPTWAAAAMAKLCGDTRNLFWLRIPNAIMSLLLLWFVFRFTSDWYNPRAGLFALLMLATSLQFIGEVQTARWDMFVGTLGFGSLWAACRAFAATQGGWRYAILATILGGASFLSKGPAAFVTIWLPFFMAYGLFFWLTRRVPDVEAWHAVKSHLPRTVRHWVILCLIGLGTLLLGNAWWFGVWLWHPDTWHMLQKDVVSVNVEHGGTFVFYLGMALPLIAPWSLLLLAALIWWGKSLWHWQRPRTTSGTQQHILPVASFFPFIWLVLALLLLSCIPAKKNRYFLMLLPILAVFLGMVCDYLARQLNSGQWLWQQKLVLAVHRALVLAAVFLVPVGFIALTYFGAPATVWCFAPLFIAVGFIFLRGRWDIPYLVVTTAAAAFLSVSVTFLYLPYTPLAKDGYEEAYVVKRLCQGEPLYLVGGDSDKLLWGISHSYRKIVKLEDFALFPWPAMLLTDTEQQSACTDKLQEMGLSLAPVTKFTIYEHRQEFVWHLYRVSKN
jgi:4-amino-4-deoxy-L-arabinose transferase-like glycosyltransferase